MSTTNLVDSQRNSKSAEEPYWTNDTLDEIEHDKKVRAERKKMAPRVTETEDPYAEYYRPPMNNQERKLVYLASLRGE